MLTTLHLICVESLYRYRERKNEGDGQTTTPSRCICNPPTGGLDTPLQVTRQSKSLCLNLLWILSAVYTKFPFQLSTQQGLQKNFIKAFTNMHSQVLILRLLNLLKLEVRTILKSINKKYEILPVPSEDMFVCYRYLYVGTVPDIPLEPALLTRRYQHRQNFRIQLYCSCGLLLTTLYINTNNIL